MKGENMNKVFIAYVYLCICLLTIIHGQCTKKKQNSLEIFYNKTYSEGDMLTCEKSIGLSKCIDTCASLGGCSYVNFYPKKLLCALMTTHANLTLSSLVEDETQMEDDEGNEFVLMKESAVICETKECREGYICLETASGRKSCHLKEKECRRGRYLVAGLFGVQADSVVPTELTFSSRNCSTCTQFQLNGPSAWVAGIRDSFQFVRVTFRSRIVVTGVVTQGSGRSTVARVYLYNVMYIACNDKWIYIKDDTGKKKVFPGNSDQVSFRVSYFQRPISTKGIQIYPLSWNGDYLEMRFDLLGC